MSFKSINQSINQTIGLTCKLSSVRMTLMHRENRLAAECSRKSSVLSSCLKLTGEVAQRVFADKLFQTSCSKQPEPSVCKLARPWQWTISGFPEDVDRWISTHE